MQRNYENYVKLLRELRLTRMKKHDAILAKIKFFASGAYSTHMQYEFIWNIRFYGFFGNFCKLYAFRAQSFCITRRYEILKFLVFFNI